MTKRIAFVFSVFLFLALSNITGAEPIKGEVSIPPTTAAKAALLKTNGAKPPQPTTSRTGLPALGSKEPGSPSDMKKQEASTDKTEDGSKNQRKLRSERNSAEGPSQIEQYMSGNISPVISTEIQQFGYDLFDSPPSTFAPVSDVPVGPDYILGPGDEIKVTAWGQIEGQWKTAVERDGTIVLPKVGTLAVAGLNFTELKNILNAEFSKFYKGFQLSLSMGALRTIRIYLVGNAQKPGAYTVSSLSTLVNALFETGGPSKTGSMRQIELKRKGKPMVTFDMYDFLLKGDKTQDIRLMPDDVIFIPPIGPVAGIAGNIKTPAVYELKNATRITDLIAMAGGVTATGYLQRIQAERIYNNEVKIVADTNLKDLDQEHNIILRDLDIIKIFPIKNVVVNAVEVKGNVVRPGQYQWFQGMSIRDIIKDPEKDLLPETYFDNAIIERYVLPDFHKEIISIDLGKALLEKDQHECVQFQPYDVLQIFSKWDLAERPIVKISGAVNKPGDYELRSKMKVSDLLRLAGGLQYFAYTERAELTRVKPTPDGPQTELICLDLTKALGGDPANDLILAVNDYLLVRTVPEWQLYREVSVRGEVKFPGSYAIQRGEKISSLIERAGGYTGRAYLRGAIFTRNSVKLMQQKGLDEMVSRLEREMLAETSVQASSAVSSEEIQSKKLELESKQKFVESLKSLKASGRMVIKLAHLRLLKGSDFDIELEEGDSLTIPEINKVINVTGAVMSPGSFIYVDKARYMDYIAEAGGLSKYADKDNIFVFKADGSARKVSQSFLGWNSQNSRWELASFSGQKKDLEPGDSVIVPEKLERVAWLREIKDITQILMQIAVVAGVAVNLF